LAEKYGVAPETISDIVDPDTQPSNQTYKGEEARRDPPLLSQTSCYAPKEGAVSKEPSAQPEEGEDEGGDQKPIPEDPIDPSSEELQAKEKKTELDCGTGAGGFQPGNSCAGGGGIQSSIRDATPSGYGPSASSQEKTKEQRMRGESIDDAINQRLVISS
jgi:hypothetical protein